MENQITEESIQEEAAFRRFYKKILTELDSLHRGVFNEENSDRTAALCLLGQVGLSKLVAEAEHRARSIKRDIEFQKGDIYLNNKSSSEKKVTDAAMTAIIAGNEKVIELQKSQSEAEKEAKDLATILGVLKDAHLLFRALIRKGG